MSAQVPDRHGDLQYFYDLLRLLEKRIGGTRLLSACTGRMDWPRRGVYFFFEPEETRSDSGTGPRVVRVGTHALTATSTTTLWNRLSQHRGSVRSGGGNHRGSIFRLLVGAAMAQQDGMYIESWGRGSSANAQTRQGEVALERRVSAYIGAMPFLWIEVGGDGGPEGLRGYIERNSIGLLSNYERPPLDPPSRGWLGHASDRPRIRASGLWNQNHVDESWTPAFLDEFERLVTRGRRT